MTVDLDKKLRDRLRFRSWHRGTKEMDLMLGTFADAELYTLSPELVAQYEKVLEQNDPDLYNWITGKEPIPAEQNSDVMRLLCAHRVHEKLC